jgi:hypothetical protein
MKQPGIGLIDLHDLDALAARRPLLIAHRGGVVTAASPENSGAAIRLAASEGYDLVELDVRVGRDGEPVLFHGARGRLVGTSAGDVPVDALTVAELGAVRYDGTDERVLTLDEGLARCRSLDLGVMLDVKIGEVDVTPALAARIAALLAAHGLTRAAMTISPVPRLCEAVGPELLFPTGADELRQLAEGDGPDLRGRFWFGIPKHLPEELIGPMQHAGALVIPAINRFRYPRRAGLTPGREDIARLLALGADGFQIDAVYRDVFPA